MRCASSSHRHGIDCRGATTGGDRETRVVGVTRRVHLTRELACRPRRTSCARPLPTASSRVTARATAVGTLAKMASDIASPPHPAEALPKAPAFPFQRTQPLDPPALYAQARRHQPVFEVTLWDG